MPKGQRTNETSQRILAHARHAFNERGVMNVGIREIARDLDLSPGNLSYHFPTKEALIVALVDHGHHTNNEEVATPAVLSFTVLDTIFRAIMRRDIAKVADVYFSTHEQYQQFMRTMLAHRFQPKLTEEIMREVIQPLRDKFIRYLAEGQRRGLVRPQIELSPAVDAFTGMIFAAVLRRAVYSPGYSRETYLRTCVDLFLEGICA